MRTSIRDVDLVVDIIRLFGEMKYEGDELWDFVTTLFASNLASVTDAFLVLDAMRGFASAKRGSDSLWEYLVKKAMSLPHPNDVVRQAAILRFLSELSIPSTTESGIL